ncbi:hypothetical protein Hdeb2414_s0005g00177121 [Helianthus debilis subsp. tardiflorus]
MIVWFPDKDWLADMLSAPDEKEIMREKHKRRKNPIRDFLHVQILKARRTWSMTKLWNEDTT